MNDKISFKEQNEKDFKRMDSIVNGEVVDLNVFRDKKKVLTKKETEQRIINAFIKHAESLDW